MLFKELKPNYTTYHLHRNGDIKVGQGKVTVVSQPRVQPSSNPALPVSGTFATTQTMVVDVTIEEGGQTKTYTIPENLDITYSGTDLVIAASREKILAEVEAMKSRADEAIASVPKHKKISEQCQIILEEWNPAIKEKRENEERLSSLESKIAKVTSLVENLVEKLS